MIVSSESVGDGHPDKVADQISDAILDLFIKHDKESKVAVEVIACFEKIIVAGEVKTKYHYNKQELINIVKQTLNNIDYYNDSRINVNNLIIEIYLNKQSCEINQAVIQNNKVKAGDQGLMFGYACDYFNEYTNDDYLPLPISLAHSIIRYAIKQRKQRKIKWLCPDFKTQVIVNYDPQGKNGVFIQEIIFSCQHTNDINLKQLKENVKKMIIIPVLKLSGLYNDKIIYKINYGGLWHVGGWLSDTGLTGRKIIVDTYGGWAHHGGGSFSGKDGSKVDRSAAYYLRYIAKNLVASGLCHEIEIQASYVIGKSNPLSINVMSRDKDNLKSDEQLIDIVRKEFNLKTYKIIKSMKLKTIKYLPLACGGHFGKNALDYPWEKLDKVNDLKKYLSK